MGMCLILYACVAGTPLDTEAVDVRPGRQIEAIEETRDRMERAYRRLCTPPLDAPEFVLADVHFHVNRRFTQYSGDISGRMLGALQALGPLIGRDSPMIQSLLEGFHQYQQPDGHFGVAQDLAAGVDQDRDMPILWGNGRLLLALAERCREHPDPGLLAIARRIGDYVISTRPYYGKRENFETVGGMYSSGFTTCYPSLIDGLAALGEETGDARYLDEARFIARLSLLDREFSHRHSHGRLSAYRGMLDLDRITGTREFLPVVREAVQTITRQMLLPTGGVTERFDRDGDRDEGCTQADWLRVNYLLWQATGDTSCLDMVEHTMRNHLFATQLANGGFGHYYWEPLEDRGQAYAGARITHIGAEAYWCCSMHGAQILADLARWSVSSVDQEVLITWLGEVRSTLAIGDARVIVTTDRVEPGAWTVTLESDRPASVVLRCRVPDWSSGIQTDLGFMEDATNWLAGRNGWARIAVNVRDTTTVRFHLDTRVREAGPYTPAPVAGAPVRLFSGPDLLCLPDAFLPAELASSGIVPTICFTQTTADDEGLPVVAVFEGHAPVRTRLVRMADRPPGGCRFLFNPDRLDPAEYGQRWNSADPQPEAGTPVELAFAGSGEFLVHLNGRLLLRRWGWSEPSTIEAYARPGSNIVAVLAHPGRKEAQTPMLMGRISTPAGSIVTRVADWTVIPSGGKPDPVRLIDPAAGADAEVVIEDVGGLGDEPWGYIPAAYAGDDVRAIWPAADNGNDRWWLFRFAFILPE